MTTTQPAATTSWDDGRSLNLWEADALFSRGLPVTFDVPTRTGYDTLRPVNLRDLSRNSERCMSYLVCGKFAELHLATIRNAGRLELFQTREADQQSFRFRFSTADDYRTPMEIWERARVGHGRP